MEQPFEDADKAMTSQIPRAGVWCDEGHHDDDDDDDDVSLFSDPKVAASLPEQQLDWACPAFKWNLLAMTICYNHVDVL